MPLITELEHHSQLHRRTGLSDPDIFFTDKQNRRNWECISLFCDEEPVLAGRTPIQCYRDFCESFREMCGSDLGSTVTEVAIGKSFVQPFDNTSVHVLLKNGV